MRYCKSCRELKDDQDFLYDNGKQCKDCYREKCRLYTKKRYDPEKNRISTKRWREKNPDYDKKHYHDNEQYYKDYYQQNKDKYLERSKHRNEYMKFYMRKYYQLKKSQKKATLRKQKILDNLFFLAGFKTCRCGRRVMNTKRSLCVCIKKDEKYCSKCYSIKNKSEFYHMKSGRYSSYCIKCELER